jgi:hypothetical protein
MRSSMSRVLMYGSISMSIVSGDIVL